MLDKDISEAIYNELIHFNLKHYINSLSNVENINPNDTCNSIVNILLNLNHEQKEVFFNFLKTVIIDTASTILGTIDGTTFIKDADGEYILKYNNEDIQGCLQDYFLAKAEEDKDNKFIKHSN